MKWYDGSQLDWEVYYLLCCYEELGYIPDKIIYYME